MCCLHSAACYLVKKKKSLSFVVEFLPRQFFCVIFFFSWLDLFTKLFTCVRLHSMFRVCNRSFSVDTHVCSIYTHHRVCMKCAGTSICVVFFNVSFRFAVRMSETISENWANMIVSKDTRWQHVCGVLWFADWIFALESHTDFEAFGLNTVTRADHINYFLFDLSPNAVCKPHTCLLPTFFFSLCRSANTFDICQLQHFDMLIIIKLAYFCFIPKCGQMPHICSRFLSLFHLSSSMPCSSIFRLFNLVKCLFGNEDNHKCKLYKHIKR